MIFVPKLKVIEPKGEFACQSRFKGEWKLMATNRYSGKQRVLADWFPNLVLDIGLDRIGIAQGWLGSCFVGSGNSLPNELQTSLDNLVASTSTRTLNTATSSGAAPWYSQNTITYRFAQGAAAGNLSEIGVGWASSGLWSRALILDGLGEPTTITVLADEFLDATYRLRCYAPDTDVVTEMTIDGVTTTVTARASDANQQFVWFSTSPVGPRGGGDTVASSNRHNVFSGTIGLITGSPGGTSSGAGPGAANQAYVSGTYFRDYSTTWPISQGNVGSVRSYRTRFGDANGGFGVMQFQFDPPIAKDATKTMVLTTRHSWGRYTP